MVVYDIHIDTKPVCMQCLHHLFHLVDANLAVVWVRTVGALGHIIIFRVVAPVKLRCVELCLIHCRIVVTRQYLYMRHTQLLDVVNPCRKPVRIFRASLRQPKELARIADAG